MTQTDSPDNRPGNAGTAPAAATVASLETELAAAQARADEQRGNYLRAVAEMENFRKRTERELDQARKFAIERFAQELLAVSDALEAGISSGANNPGPALLDGAKATLRELTKAFEKVGIQTLDPLGKPFDPNWHEAMVAQESAGQPPGTVLNVVQKGYSLNGRLLRPARVIVSKAPGQA